MDSTKTPFDAPWKEILEAYFAEFVAFFFPAVHDQIDWAKGFEFMDGELQQLAREAETSRLYADKLVKVYWLDGSEQFILLHVEVQCQKEEVFPSRVFTYFARIRDRFQKPVISLVVLGDENQTWQPQSYTEEIGGCRLQFDFPTVKLLDYRGAEGVLADSMNPFAHVVLAHLAALATKRNNQNRRREKFTVTRRLYDRGFGRQDIINVYRFIDWVMTLPPELEKDFQQELRDFEGELAMTYITSIERSGIEQGRQEGKLEVVIKLLEQRLVNLPTPVKARIAAVDSGQLDELSDFNVLLGFHSIDDLTAWLDSH
jgi:Domain of unknown function (DUF4351)